MTYDPIPDLAALIDGLHDAISGDLLMIRLTELLTGPYARLRGGLLLDFENTGLSTAEAIRQALAS